MLAQNKSAQQVMNPLGRKLPEADADQDVVYDEFSFEEIRLTKWRRCLTFLPEEEAIAGDLVSSPS